MLFNQITYIGIDPTAGKKPFAYAALDNDLNPIALGEARMEEILAFTAGQRQAYVAICAPRQPNQGFMAEEVTRRNLNPIPKTGRWENFRVAEYMLRQFNISTPNTPKKENVCKKWMRLGFSVYRNLASMGYHPYPTPGADLQTLEVYPHATFTSILGVSPFPKNTFEGRIQRQLVLFEKMVKIYDPMRIFEEITRFRLLNGVIPDKQLLSPGELDAMIAAYTAWMVENHPEQTSMLGEPAEGQIVLPVAELRSKY